MENDNSITLEGMKERFPKLCQLFVIASDYKDSDEKVKWKAYSRIKKLASELVGWESPDEQYRNGKAYDLMIEELTRRLRI